MERREATSGLVVASAKKRLSMTTVLSRESLKHYLSRTTLSVEQLVLMPGPGGLPDNASVGRLSCGKWRCNCQFCTDIARVHHRA